jgi:hypothetical protein
MRFIVDKLSSLITYLKSFFIKQHQPLQDDIEAQRHSITIVTPKNPMDDLPECNFRAEREQFAFRI